MNNNVKIAKQLVRIARMIVAFNHSELEKQLSACRPDLNKKEFKKYIDCLDKMNAKEQKAALFWIKRKSLSLPKDENIFNMAMNLVNKQHLDFQKFESPNEVIDRNDISTQRILSQDAPFDPAKEKAFSHPYDAGGGVIIYWVEDSPRGQDAVRRAIDTSWGYDKNPWCITKREKKTNEWSQFTNMDWEQHSVYPKRIAFKDGKLIGFCASMEPNHIFWWDKNNESYENLEDLGAPGAKDDPKFIKKYGKINYYTDLLYEDKLTSKMKRKLLNHPDDSIREWAEEYLEDEDDDLDEDEE